MKPTNCKRWKVDKRIGCIAIYEEEEDFNCLEIPKQAFVAFWPGYTDEKGNWQIHEKDLINARHIVDLHNRYIVG